MAIAEVKELLEAGVHYGHRTSRWNPKMKPFIFGRRNMIHIIDLRETLRGLIRAYHFIAKVAAEGKEVLFVGTKRQASQIVRAEAQACGSPFVSERWIGGTLTNHQTILKQLDRLLELERLESSGELQTYSKKMISAFNREKRRLLRNLQGIRSMTKLPGALVVIDPRHEHTAVREANKLGIPVVGFLDTDCDPDVVDIPIPGNDDAIRSIQVVCHKLSQAVLEGKRAAEQLQAAADSAEKAAATAEQVTAEGALGTPRSQMPNSQGEQQNGGGA